MIRERLAAQGRMLRGAYGPLYLALIVAGALVSYAASRLGELHDEDAKLRSELGRLMQREIEREKIEDKRRWADAQPQPGAPVGHATEAGNRNTHNTTTTANARLEPHA
jgi:hypothetical protein